MAGKRTIICPINAEIAHLWRPIQAHGGHGIIILYKEPRDPEKERKIKELIPDEGIPKEFYYLTDDFSNNVREFRGLIRQEKDKGREVYIDVSQGGPTVMYAALLASFLEHSKVSSISFWEQAVENELPLLEWSIKPIEKEIIALINKGITQNVKIAKILKKSEGRISQIVGELIEKGYIEKDVNAYALTEIGQIMAESKGGVQPEKNS